MSTAQGQQQVGLAGAAQEAQIGQTAYGEGANTASELAGLGQTAYGEGANTASEYAALGTGAQTAGLQGAQAQIGAGTLEQQTQQAQDQALYNQFLQQQSYPFQVDQFLANVSEGTGALSGSTTTTTQPGGFFSDERLKTDKRPIGKTFDEQTIYSYKMKGDPRTRIGLMAQDVEEKHPEAVGVSAGYRTVDYGKATKEAANEGHFNRGGVVPIRKAAGGGLTSDDLDTILATQQQMYSGVAGGPRATTGAPHGGVAHVPPPMSGGSSGLQVASGGLRAQPTGMQNVNAVGQLAKTYGDLYRNDVKPMMGNGEGSTVTTTTPGGLAPGVGADGSTAGQFSNDQLNALSTGFASDSGPADYSAPAGQWRGGRQGYAGGGDTPYSDDGLTISIPDENPHNQLSKPAQLPPQSPTGFQQIMSGLGGMGGMGGSISGMFGGGGGGGSGLDASTLFDSGSTAGDALTALDSAARRGGRIHRDTGGSFDADSAQNSSSVGDAPDTSLDQAPALAHGAPNTSLDAPMKIAKDAWQAYSAGASAYGAYGYLAALAAAARGGRIGKADAGAVDGLTDDSGNPVEVQADSPTPTFAGVAPEPVAYTGGIGAVSDPPDPGPTPNADIPPPNPDSPKEAKKQPDPDVDHWYNHVHAADVVPLLSGIAAMGTAPTRSWGTALAAGLGAGAQSYMPAQEAAANIGQTQARTQGYGLQNQMTQAKLSALHDQLSSIDSPDSSGPSAPVGTAADPYGYRAQLNVPKAMKPNEEHDYQTAGVRDSILGTHFAPLVMQKFQNRLAMDLNKSQQTAQDQADALYQKAVSSPNPAEADDATRRYNDIHQYTGDNYEDRGGVLYNSRTNQRPIGDAAQTIPPSVLANLTAEGNKLVEVPTSTPGVTRQMPQYQAVPGNYRSADDYARALWQKSMVPTAASAPPRGVAPAGGASAAAASGVSPGAPSAAPAPVRTAPATGPGATAVGLASQPPRPARVAPPRAVVPPANPAESQLPTLPGLDLSTLPRIPESREQLHVTPSTTKTSMNDTMNKQRDEILNTASGTQVLANQKEALLTPMLNKIASINPRDVGPGSEAYKTFLSLKDAIFKESGKPSDLVDMGVIDKFANQLGVQNVRSLLEGQRITNQEMMTFMNRASASTTQPIDVMKQIVAYTKANNDFDILAANTKTRALVDPNVDPRQANSVIDAHRDAFVQADMAKILGQAAPAPRPGQQSSGAPVVTSKAQYDALPSGAPYVWNGKQMWKQ